MSLLENLTVFGQWLVINSLKASVVVGIILILRFLLRKRLPAKWQHALWFLLFFRLILPFEISSPFSLYNWTDEVAYQSLPPQMIFERHIPQPADSPSQVSTTVPAAEQSIQVLKGENPMVALSLDTMLALVWLVVATGLFMGILLGHLRQCRLLKAAQAVTNATVLKVLEEAKEQLGIKRSIALHQLQQRDSAFWCGIFRPRIFLPVDFIKNFSPEQLHYIFLHELAHYKRKDILLAFFTMILQVLHWFNPVIWYAFYQMRGDRETACDALALQTLNAGNSEKYGQTLISVLRHASRNRLMPLTVGLADGRENLKHRISMIARFSRQSRWWILVFITVLLAVTLFTLTCASKVPAISGKITFQDSRQPDSVYVGLYPYNWNAEFYGSGGEAVVLNKIISSEDYHFSVPPGMYTLVAWAFGYDYTQFHVYIEEETHNQHVDIELAKLGLSERIEHVALFGDYCLWDRSKAMQLIKKGEVWVPETQPALYKGQRYKFCIWEGEITDFREFLLDPTIKPYYRYSLESKKNVASKNWATFDNIYEGEEIVFKPALYQIPQQEAVINASWPLAQQFNRLPDDIYIFTLEMVRPINASIRSLKVDEHYYKMRAKLDSLEQLYSPTFGQYFNNQKLRMYELFNPLRQNERFLYKTPVDSAAMKEYFEGNLFNKHFAEILDLVRNVDINSWFLTTDNFVFNLVYQIPRYLETWPALSEKYDITRDECFSTLDSLVRNAKNPQCRESALLSLRRRYTYMDSTELAQKYEKILYEQFPDGWAVNAIEEEKNRISWSSLNPYPAPEFEVTTLTGETIKLSDYRGKFVYIDFWGSWCGPCRMEFPNIISMAETIPNEKLQIIGLAKDDEKALRAYLEKNPLPYPNALVDDSLLKIWKIEHYPTTFLIDPEGNVIAMEIRGAGVTKRMKQEITSYFANK